MKQKYLAQLRWNCRRGMLELDVILQRFFDQQFLKLSEAEQKQFEKLLMRHDQELFNWLLKTEQPEDRELQPIVQMIRRQAAVMPAPLQE